MITSYYTTKLGLEPETIAYNDYAIANNFEVRDLSYIDSIYKKLKELNLLGNLRHWSSSLGGVKKDVNNAVSELLSLDSGRRNVIQPLGSAQPILNGDYITYDGVSQWMYRNPQDLISSYGFTFGGFGIDQNTNQIRNFTSFTQSNSNSQNISQDLRENTNNPSNRIQRLSNTNIQNNLNEDGQYTKQIDKKVFQVGVYELSQFYGYLNGIEDTSKLSYTELININNIDYYSISALNRQLRLTTLISERVDDFVFDKALTKSELDAVMSISKAKFNY